MIVRIDPASPSPPSDQLVAQVIAQVGEGRIRPGDRLPTIRSLARDLGLAPGTVARAYAELEREGWVHTQGRRGTIVAERASKGVDRRIEEAADELAAAVVASRLGLADAHRALEVAFARRSVDR